MIAIYPIVEGHGEVQAFPLLLRRIAAQYCEVYDLEVLRAHRLSRGKMLATDAAELIKATELGARKLSQDQRRGAVMVLLDADNECPAEIGPRLLNQISRPDLLMSVVVAKKEYESWFLAGVRSLRGHRGVSLSAEPPTNPESIRGAKEYLENELFDAEAIYSPTIDQAALTAVIDLDEARTLPSFDKLCRDLVHLVSTVASDN